jgi:hypothetical protein
MTLPRSPLHRMRTACSSFGLLSLLLVSGAASAGTWQAAGVGDCAGYDVAGSPGAIPDAAKCDARFAGLTAVCWATGCSYKNIPTASCVGGPSPGQLFTCTAAEPKPQNLAWRPVGLGNCAGNDVAGTAGPYPDPGKCTVNFAGNMAVCWANGCTYKTMSVRECRGGANPGQMYICGEPDAAAAAMAPAGPPTPAATPTPSAAVPMPASPPSSPTARSTSPAAAPAAQPASASPPSGKVVKVTGKHYYVVNYKGEQESPHEFVVNWTGCKVAELGDAAAQGKEVINVVHCRPGKRLVVKAQFSADGAWTLYDWVVLENGAVLAGSYHEQTIAGPSVGRRAR